MRALLVDDDPRDRELMTAALQSRGVEVISARNDLEAYELIASEDVDMLVADIDLGVGTTGFDVARAFRRSQPRLPVVYVTAHDIDPSFHKVPGSDFLRKGDSLGSLAAAVLRKVRARIAKARTSAGRGSPENDAR